MALGAAGRLAEAEDRFRKAIRRAPREPHPHYELGYTLFLMGRYDEALEEYTRTEELHQGFFLVQTEIHVCEQVLAGRFDTNMIKWLRELQRLTDMGAGQSEEAVSISRMVLQRDPDCALGHFFLGKALIERSPDEARQSLERCVALEPDDTTIIDARGHLGLLLRNVGKAVETRDIWESIVRDYPDNPHIAMVKMALGTE
jgi:tetratricopeptide (TPR) repeat protein